MDSTTRYLIVTFFIIVFAVLAPIIVLFITGKGLPFQDISGIGSGIIDIKTLPDGAEIYLDDKKVGTSPTTIRFVKQGWHKIRAEKEGYYSWSKEVFVEAGQVTYAGTLQDTARLFIKSEPQTLASQVNQALVIEDKLVYTREGNQLYLLNIAKNQLETISLAGSLQSLNATKHQDIFFAKTSEEQWVLINLSNPKPIKLPKIYNQATHLEIGPNQTIFGLINNQLYSWTQSKTPQLLSSQISGFTILGSIIYIQRQAPQSELATYYWNGSSLDKQSVLLNKGVDHHSATKLFISEQKELFILANSSLYRINQQPELIHNNVVDFQFNPTLPSLTFITPSEVYFYNFLSAKAELFSRDSTGTTTALVLPQLGYGFTSTPSGTWATEIDLRGQQNRYQIQNSRSTKFFTTKNNKDLILLSEGRLQLLKLKK